MSETSPENTPIVINGINLEITTYGSSIVSVGNFQEKDTRNVVIYFLDAVAFGDSRSFDDKNKAIVQRFKDDFIERDLEKVLTGEQRAFKEMRFSVSSDGLGKNTLLLIDNMENRKQNGELKEWLLEVIREKETNKDTK